MRKVLLSGEQKQVLPGPGRFILRDVGADGRLLLEERTERRALMCKPPGEDAERDLSWLDHSTVAAISRDGSLLLLGETGVGGGENHAIYVRKTDGSPAVRLGEGLTNDFSSDERWVTSLTSGPEPKVVLLPVRAGRAPDATRLRGAGARRHAPARRAPPRPRGRPRRPAAPHVRGRQRDRSAQRYRPGGDRRSRRPLAGWAALFAIGSDGKGAIYPIDGGEPRPVPGYEAGEWPAGWSADGRFLYFFSTSGIPLRVGRVDLETGRREPWKVIAPADSAGVRGIDMFVASADGRSYAYSFSRAASTLYVVEGAR